MIGSLGLGVETRRYSLVEGHCEYRWLARRARPLWRRCRARGHGLGVASAACGGPQVPPISPRCQGAAGNDPEGDQHRLARVTSHAEPR
jgi:hypothetical protein